MSHQQRLGRTLSAAIIGGVGLIGIASFLYPFFLPSLQTGGAAAPPRADAPFLIALLFILSLVVLFAEIESRGLNTRMVAALGVLTAINAVLRLADLALALAGFSPMFLLVILCGYVYGSRFGFLLGALSMGVSAIVTGGIGPWLPYQMFTMGWVGLTAGWLPRRRLRGAREAHARAALNRETLTLALFAAGWGLLYGAILNLYFWPFATGGALNWTAGLSPAEGLRRYLLFYAATSLWWDVTRAVGSAAMVLLFGAPVLKVLRRFERRFQFTLLDPLPPPDGQLHAR